MTVLGDGRQFSSFGDLCFLWRFLSDKEVGASAEQPTLADGDIWESVRSQTSIASQHGFPPYGVDRRAGSHTNSHATTIILHEFQGEFNYSRDKRAF